MVLKIVLGIVLGTLLARWIRRRRCRRVRVGVGFGGLRRLRRHLGHHGFHGPGLFLLARDLRLTPEQVTRLRPLWLSGRDALARARWSQGEAVHGLLSAVASEPLERTRLEAVAARHAEEQAQAGRDLVDAIAAASEILTPEQRDRLRARLGWSSGAESPPFGGGDGPYRTVL